MNRIRRVPRRQLQTTYRIVDQKKIKIFKKFLKIYIFKIFLKIYIFSIFFGIHVKCTKIVSSAWSFEYYKLAYLSLPGKYRQHQKIQISTQSLVNVFFISGCITSTTNSRPWTNSREVYCLARSAWRSPRHHQRWYWAG